MILPRVRPRWDAEGNRLAACSAVALCVTLAVAPAGSSDIVQPSLDDVLARLSGVAALYRDNALRFTCDETIDYQGPSSRSSWEFKYVYRYDEAGQLADHRSPVLRDGMRVESGPIDGNVIPAGLPTFVQRAYSWFTVYETDKRMLYRFDLAGEDEALGRTAIQLTFDALPPRIRGVNDWSGTAWIDRQTFQLLRVEALQHRDREAQRRLDTLMAQSPATREKAHVGTVTISRVSTEFGVDKNGMRFPSEVVIERSDHFVRDKRGKRSYKERPVYRITQSYDGYRFFHVRTTEQVRSVVFGD